MRLSRRRFSQATAVMGLGATALLFSHEAEAAEQGANAPVPDAASHDANSPQAWKAGDLKQGRTLTVALTSDPRGRWCTRLPQLGRALAGVFLLVGVAGCAGLPAHQVASASPRALIPPASSSEALAAGARLAQQYCLHCHAEGGTSGQDVPTDLSGQAWTGHAWHHPDSVLVQMIADGISRPTGVMPPFGTVLRPEEIRTLIAFIKTFWTPDQQQFQRERTRRADVETSPQ